jgi:hypothetical protein
MNLTFFNTGWLDNKAAPIPAWIENFLGHPQLTSIPATSSLLRMDLMSHQFPLYQISTSSESSNSHCESSLKGKVWIGCAYLKYNSATLIGMSCEYQSVVLFVFDDTGGS